MIGPCFAMQYIMSFLALRKRGLFCYVVLCALSSFAINPLGNGGLAVLLLLSSIYHVSVVVLCPFLTVPLVGLYCLIVAYPAHTHFLSYNRMI